MLRQLQRKDLAMHPVRAAPPLERLAMQRRRVKMSMVRRL
jgi:hypothetical protein